ncbi:hypothetical protein MC885_012368, partial [Smutsia gigantea]
TLTYDTLRFAEFEDFPETSEPVWILGRKYSLFTGGTGPTSDTGWGCMLRCGQMIFAQALLCRHLGRDWRWTQRKRQPDSYFSVLNAFIDRKDSYYSIHQIAQMGVGEGKSIGQWYGPNTVAQVLKKLAVFDTWSALAVHIAMDNTVGLTCHLSNPGFTLERLVPWAVLGRGEGQAGGGPGGTVTEPGCSSGLPWDSGSSIAVLLGLRRDVALGLWEEDRDLVLGRGLGLSLLCRSSLPCVGAAVFPADSDRHCNGFPAEAEVASRLPPWRPLVLLIPLRLGLTDINEAYVETLKHCFMMPQSLGVIGGKPNSAHYFIGYVGEELIYLDPHTTQPAVGLTDSCFIPDESFHCQHPPSRMSIGELDPSIAVGFFCKTEDDFNDWCQEVRKLSLLGGALPMFELVEQQPSHLACSDVLNLSVDSSDVERLERFFDSEDEDFEILSL